MVCKPIEWSVMPRVPHGEIGMLPGRYGLRKVAGLINENANPRKPKGSPMLVRGYTLELYIPLPSGKDRVLKFTTEAAAKAEAERSVTRFVTDCLQK